MRSGTESEAAFDNALVDTLIAYCRTGGGDGEGLNSWASSTYFCGMACTSLDEGSVGTVDDRCAFCSNAWKGDKDIGAAKEINRKSKTNGEKIL